MKNVLYTIVAAVLLFAFHPVQHLQAQGSLQFSQVILVDNTLQNVPAGKVWKVESVMSTSLLVPATGTSDNTYYTIAKSIEVNGHVMIISRAARFTENYSRYNSESTTDICVGTVTELPLWLPAGTSLKTAINATYISVIEFNIVP